jgi:hypothetical protein
MDYSDTCRSVYRSRNQWLHASRWLRAARILTAISSCLASPTRLRPEHNCECPRIGLTACPYGNRLVAACRETALAHTAATTALRRSPVLRSAEVVAELGASILIAGGGWLSSDLRNGRWPWLTLLTHLPKSSSHAVPKHHRSTTLASIRVPRRARPSLSARLSLLFEPDRSRGTRGATSLTG